MAHERQPLLSLQPLSGRRLPLAGEYPHHELTLSTTPNGTAPTPVLHTIRAELRLFLSQDRSHGPFVDHGCVAAYETQSYALRVRFAAVRSGWAFEENLTLHVPRTRAVPGYYGRYSFERPGLRFDTDEALTVKLVQADWHGVSWGDWRALHAALWAVELCGTPQNVMLPIDPYATGMFSGGTAEPGVGLEMVLAARRNLAWGSTVQFDAEAFAPPTMLVSAG